MQQQINTRSFVLFIIIMLSGIYRIVTADSALSPLSNFTPLGAAALFGGVYFREKWKAYLVTLLTLWLTDIILNRYVFFGHWMFFYEGFAYVYVSYGLMVCTGHFIKNVSVVNVFLAATMGALIHWIVSDFGVWLGGCTDITTGQPYTQDAQGLVKCYYLALPYLKNMLIGNLVFSALLFSSFEWLQKRYITLQCDVGNVNKLIIPR